MAHDRSAKGSVRRARRALLLLLLPRASHLAAVVQLRAPPPGAILVDVRARAAFTARHLHGASSIPLAELEARLFELPAPSEDELALCAASEAQLGAAAELLEQRGWTVIPALDASNEEAWGVCAAAGWREAELKSEWSAPSWRPNLFLRHLLADALEAASAVERAAGLPHGDAPSTRVALDLGAGNGRDAVFLAEQLGSGWEVVAVDNHVGALERCAALAAKAGVGERVRADARNLRRPGPVAGWTEGNVRLAHGSRFLVKALLSALRDEVLVEPGALFIWSTFFEPGDGEEENRAPPFRPSRRLRRGELAALFSDVGGWRVLRDEEGELVTRGERVPAGFFAAVRERRAK